MRDEWLAAIGAQVSRIEQGTGNALDPGLLDTAQRLAEVLGDDETDLPAWHLLGRFHMQRDAAIYHAGQEGWQADNAAMLGAFARCLLAGSGRREGLDIPAAILGAVARYAGRTFLGFDARTAASEDPEATAVAEAPVMWQHIISRLSAGDPARPTIMALMCGALLLRFEAAGEVADLDAAVAVAREAVTLTDTAAPSPPMLHAVLGQALLTRFDHRGARADIDGAVTAFRQALETAPATDSSRTDFLTAYGNALRTRFEHGGDRTDLDDAISALRLAVSSAEGTTRPGLMRNVAAALVRRFDETESIADLDEAITALRQALQQASAVDSIRPGCLSSLGVALRTRFLLTWDARDLGEALSVSRQAVAEAAPADPDRPVFVGNLGTVLIRRAELSGDPEDADAAVAACREAVATLGTEHRLRATFVSNLSGVLLETSTGEADVAEAIALAREAVALTQPGHPGRGRFLMILCSALLRRLDQHDSPVDAQEAVGVARQMLDAFPPGHADRATALELVGAALSQRAALLGQAADLDEAVDVVEQALDLIPPGSERTGIALDLGATLRQRFQQTGSTEDLDRAIAIFRESAAERDSESTGDGRAHHDLGATLLLRYERTADLEDLTDAVTALRQALGTIWADPADQAQAGADLSTALRLLFTHTGQKEAIAEAVELGRQAVVSTPAGHPSRADHHLVLGKALEVQAGLQEEDVPAAASAAEAFDPAGAAERHELSARLAALVDTDAATDPTRVLTQDSLDCARRLADLVLAGAPDADAHELLGRYYLLRHVNLFLDQFLAGNASAADGTEAADDEAGADAANAALAAAIDFYALPFAVGRPVPQTLMTYLAEDAADNALAHLYERVLPAGDIAELTEAIGLWRRILDALPDDHPDRIVCVGALGTALQARYVIAGDRTDLEESLTTLRSAVTGTADDHPYLPAFRISFGEALQLKSALAQDGKERDSALDQAVGLAMRALDAAGSSAEATDTDRAVAQAQLSGALAARYRATGDRADFDRSMALLAEAAAVPAADADAAAIISAALIDGLYLKFAASGDPAALDQSIDEARRKVASTAQGQPGLAAILCTMGCALRDRAELRGSDQDLDEAIDALERGARLAVPGSPTHGSCLAYLGNALLSRFHRAGRAIDLDAATDAVTRAAALIPAGNVLKPQLDSIRARGLLARHQLTGSERDLDAALTNLHEACATVPPDHPDRSYLLSFYAGVLLAKYQRTGELDDLNASIDASRAALAATPAGHSNAVGYRLGLAASLRARFEADANDADLDEALTLTRDAMESIPTGSTLLPPLLAECGNTMLARFRASGNRTDFEQAVDLLRRAAAAAEGRRSEAHYVLDLTEALSEAYERDGSPEYREEALSLCRRVIGLPAHPALQITAAAIGANLAADIAPDVAADLLEAAVRLLPVTASRQLSRADQQNVLRHFTFLATGAAQYSLIAGGPDAPARALGLLELSRAVLQGQALDNRRDLLDLYAAHPELARHFRDLCTLLDTPDEPEAGLLPAPADAAAGFTSAAATALRATALAIHATSGFGAAGAGTDRGSEGPDRFRIGAQFAALLEQIRDQSGFESFLLPPEPVELIRHAAQGPIVVINVGDRADALVVTTTGIAHVPLPALTVESLAARIELWDLALDVISSPETTFGERAVADQVLGTVLEWLWYVAAEPVLRHLGYTAPPEPGQAWSRIWWAPGGLLGRLPLHAAGCHRAPGDTSVLDRVVSSYVPTVRALAYARERSRSTSPTSSLIVAMPTTPGSDDPLENVTAEATALKHLLPSPIVLLEPDNCVDDCTPTRDRVLSALAQVGIAHFACHASSDPNDPTRSKIYLHDHEDRPFTVGTLLPARLPHAQLAFLSACQTARNDDLDLLDEAIHLTTAFQQAGFPHVIGTLWRIPDTDVAVDIAVQFYRRLQTSQGTLAVADCARVLHDTVRSMRHLPPSQWAAHIHVGA